MGDWYRVTSDMFEPEDVLAPNPRTAARHWAERMLQEGHIAWGEEVEVHVCESVGGPAFHYIVIGDWAPDVTVKHVNKSHNDRTPHTTNGTGDDE